MQTMGLLEAVGTPDVADGAAGSVDAEAAVPNDADASVGVAEGGGPARASVMLDIVPYNGSLDNVHKQVVAFSRAASAQVEAELRRNAAQVAAYASSPDAIAPLGPVEQALTAFFAHPPGQHEDGHACLRSFRQ